MLFRFAHASAILAAASLVATPVAAAQLPRVSGDAAVSTASVFDADSVTADAHRRWRYRDRVDAGDVIAGVLVLGTIAAVASAASKAKQDRVHRYPQPYPNADRPYDYRGRSSGAGYEDSRGIDRAVDMCVREVERSSAIDTVDNVERTGSGWRVSGRLNGGAPFNCSIGNDGRIEGLDVGRIGAAQDNQWDDDRYAAARQVQDGVAVPAYPGGPIGDEDAAGDGRYEAAAAPDFEG